MSTVHELPHQVAARVWPEPMSGCWLWEGSAVPRGYGTMTVAQTPRRVHVFVYEALVGPVPEGLELDHLCNTPACCNPAHLEPVTHAENVRRAAARRTHCPKGHAWTPENTYRRVHRNGAVSRNCRACNREKHRG